MRAGRQRRILATAVVGAALLMQAGCGGGSDDARSTATTMAKATATNQPEGPATDFSRPGIAVIAHRGASAFAPEHTNAAYTLAIEQGADYIEQDVQLTKDGQLIVMHDPSLDRTARGPAGSCTGFVSEKTVQDLSTCDVGTWFNEAYPDLAKPDFARQRILTLDEVLDSYGNDARFYIEVKAPDDQPGLVDALLALLDEHPMETGDSDLPPVVIQSFSAESLKDVHEQRTDLPLVQLIRQGEAVPDGAALEEIATYAVAIGPPQEVVTPDLVDAAVARCLDVHPYTVNEPKDMGSMLDAGVGGMFTNDPGRLVEILEPNPPIDTGLCPAKATAG